ncbi:MAG: DUF6434 domain-containing protein [Hyphomicrobiales bacterium]
MSKRPLLSIKLTSTAFKQYYYLKEELVNFCRKNHLRISGNKEDLTKRIIYFLETSKQSPEKINYTKYTTKDIQNLSLNSIIEENFVCSEKHRSFFSSIIGKAFSFNVAFQKYLKSNAGKTYTDAVNEWYAIQEDKKKNKGKSKIDPQFEYNTYIRDFFKMNDKDNSLHDAIKCWKFKKSIAGHNKYEKTDLLALKK